MDFKSLNLYQIDYDNCNDFIKKFDKGCVVFVDRENQALAFKDTDGELHVFDFVNINYLNKCLEKLIIIAFGFSINTACSPMNIVLPYTCSESGSSVSA